MAPKPCKKWSISHPSVSESFLTCQLGLGYLLGYRPLRTPRYPQMQARLSDTKIRSFLRNAAPGQKLGDGGGLVIFKLKSGGGSWRWNYIAPNGKEQTLVYGTYDEVSLRQVRDEHIDARRQLSKGVDPKEADRIAKRSASDTFESIANEFIEARMVNAMPPRLVQLALKYTF